MILAENATRFCRDLAVQLAGHALLQDRGIELVPVDAPTFFTDPSPTAHLREELAKYGARSWSRSFFIFLVSAFRTF